MDSFTVTLCQITRPRTIKDDNLIIDSGHVWNSSLPAIQVERVSLIISVRRVIRSVFTDSHKVNDNTQAPVETIRKIENFVDDGCEKMN
ncbi:hypothetical protein KIN20_002336 [Parelaphostrongylus tenuis]|uniref:Uncharacterized protein n=1 Tax=Parelaphostrongylus tenuis TaxID=148309 RepID=A0AAD5MNF7_PARTN|nr:hypothetical protein KIN20_002336 [Parelaphostrongylus tenuis]